MSSLYSSCGWLSVHPLIWWLGEDLLTAQKGNKIDLNRYHLKIDKLRLEHGIEGLLIMAMAKLMAMVSVSKSQYI